MDKKLRLSISYVVLLSLFIGATILYSKPADRNRFLNKSFDNRKFDTAEDKSIHVYKSEISKNEDISISNNSSELNLQAKLLEDMGGQVSLALSYKLDGKIIKKNLNTSNISEIRNIFRFREKYKNGYRLTNMVLNKKMNKLYFCVEGKKEKNYTYTAIYSYSLNNFKAERLLYNIGVFSDFYISPDEKFNAFSYLDKDKFNNSNSNNTVVIIRCQDNKLVLSDNRDINGKQLGNNNYMYAYSYDFIKWLDSNTCVLKQCARIKDGSQKVRQQMVHYSVTSNYLKEEV